MAFRTVHCDAEKRLGCMVDGVFHPGLAAQELIVTDKKPGGAEGVLVGWCDFIRGQHQRNHPVVRHIAIQRLDNPVTPAPDMRLRIADLATIIPAGPVGVAPDVHKVASPALAVCGTCEEAVDEAFVGIRAGVAKKSRTLSRGWREPRDVHRCAAKEHFLGCG